MLDPVVKLWKLMLDPVVKLLKLMLDPVVKLLKSQTIHNSTIIMGVNFFFIFCFKLRKNLWNLKQFIQVFYYPKKNSDGVNFDT